MGAIGCAGIIPQQQIQNHNLPMGNDALVFLQVNQYDL
jgi:hypothetical protein